MIVNLRHCTVMPSRHQVVVVRVEAGNIVFASAEVEVGLNLFY